MNRFVIALLCLLAVVGCNKGPKKPAGLPELHPLTLTLRQDGQALATATVVLHPASGSVNWAIGGVSDEQGRIVVRTHGDFSGAPAGTYKITVRKTLREGNNPVIEYDMVEEQFTSPTTTPLQLEVGAATLKVDLDVGKAVKNKRNSE